MSFGGRGRGRGRSIPIARHDIQLTEDEQVSDVPLTFPKPPLGSMPPKAKDVKLTAEQQRLLVCFRLYRIPDAAAVLCGSPQATTVQIRFTKIRNAYRSSPFHLEANHPGQVDPVKGSVPDVGKHEGQHDAGAGQAKRRPLHEVITMHEKYMPKELFSEKEQKKSLRARKSKSKAVAIKQEGDIDFMQLQPEADGEKEEGEEDGEEKDKEGGQVQEEEDDDDEFDHEDDDYYQGEHFDDDEEYDEVDDGEGEAYF